MSKHPYNRLIFFLGNPTLRYSLREIKSSVIAGVLAPDVLVHDTSGGIFAAGDIGRGVAPKWARTAEHDPALYGIPMPSAEDMALAHEAACEDDFIDMPQE